MSGFKVTPSALQSAVGQETKIASELQQCGSRIRAVAGNLALESSASARIRSALYSNAQRTEKAKKSVDKLSDSLESIRQLYLNTESRIVNGGAEGDSASRGVNDLYQTIVEVAKTIKRQLDLFWIHLKNRIDPPLTTVEIDSIVYDQDEGGDYGGDQGSPAQEQDPARRQELYDIVRKYYPDENLTDEQIDNYLDRMNSEGCGYVALINTIMFYYEGRAEQFERDFGFPMYDENGNLNYDLLLTDLYASTDNRNGYLGDVDRWKDYDSEVDGSIEAYDYWNDTTGWGSVVADNANTAFKEYMAERGVTVTVDENVAVTADNWQEIYEGGGQVIVSLHDATLYNMDGSVAQDIGGHGMTVTGYTNDGKLIVSSWGGKYYIDPEDYAGTDTTFDVIYYS